MDYLEISLLTKILVKKNALFYCKAINKANNDDGSMFFVDASVFQADVTSTLGEKLCLHFS